MKKDDLIKSILSEAEDIKIPELNERARLEPIATLPDEVAPRARTKTNYLRAFTLVLILVMGFGFYYMTVMRSVTKVTIDINPSIELTLNSSDKVISVTAYNQEGQNFIKRTNVMHKPLNDAIEDIVSLAYEMDYLKKGEENAVLFSVKSLTPGKEAYHEDGIRMTFDVAMQSRGIDATFFYTEYTSDDELFAHNHHLSPAKLAFIRELYEKHNGVPCPPSQIPSSYFNQSVVQLMNLFE